MVKVDSHVRVVIELDLAEARALRDVLSMADGGYDVWDALQAALQSLEKVKK